MPAVLIIWIRVVWIVRIVPVTGTVSNAGSAYGCACNRCSARCGFSVGYSERVGQALRVR